ncbi:flagellar hook-length control protein FliK, partial [Clostridiaceae bacterium UIB06]|nr:flagellar hook-length control protein FliK [Clostridiaceae bacterium UIB06]
MSIDTSNLNSSMNNITKSYTKAKTTTSSNSFDNLFAKVAYSKSVKSENNSTKELSQVSNKISKYDDYNHQVSNQTSKYDDNYNQNDAVKNNNVSEADSSKAVPKEVKDALKEAGMSEEEVDKINSLKDLKEKVEPDKLLSILLTLMNGNVSNVDLSNIKDKIQEQIKAIVSAQPESFANVTDETQLKNKLINGLFDRISSETNGELGTNTKVSNVKDSSNILAGLTAVTNEKLKVNLNSNETSKVDEKKSELQSVNVNTTSNTTDTKSVTKDDIISKVQAELSAALKDCLKDLKANKEETSSFKFTDGSLNAKTAEELIKSVTDGDKASDNSSLLNSNSSKSDDGVLKNLLSDNNDKISRVANFMTQFNNLKVDSNTVSDLEKMVINKNTVGNDMIKALKYMQTNDMKDLTVKINPKELGEVVIKITMEAGAMKASINAANKEAYSLLNSNLADITSKLQNNDIKIQDLSLNLYNEDTTFFKDGSNKNRSGNEQSGKKTQTIG